MDCGYICFYTRVHRICTQFKCTFICFSKHYLHNKLDEFYIIFIRVLIYHACYSKLKINLKWLSSGLSSP